MGFFTMSVANYGICAKAADCKTADACCSKFAKTSGGAGTAVALACWPLNAKAKDEQTITDTPTSGTLADITTSSKGFLIADCTKAAATGSQALVASAAAVATAVYMM